MNTIVNGKKPTYTGSGAERRQLLWLSLVITVLTLVVASLSTHAVVPYVGFFIAALGIAVSVGQFYIHSIVDRVLFSIRRDFYRGTSVSQMFFGAFILFRCISEIIVQNQGYGMKWEYALPVANSFYFASYFFGVWSLPAMVLVAVSYLYPLKPQEALRELPPLLKFWEFPSYLERLREEPHFAELHGQMRRLVISLLGFAFTFSVALFFEIALQVRDYGSTNLAPLSGLTFSIFIIAVLLTFAVSLILFVRRLQRVFSDGDGLVGFSFFMAMMALFAFPPVLQVFFAILAHYFGTPGIAIGAGFAVIGLIAVGRYYLPRLKAALPLGYSKGTMDSLGRFVPVATEYAALIILFISVAAMIVFIAVYTGWALSAEGRNPLFALVYFTFVFYVLGCNYMAAVDLRVASESAARLQEHALDEKFLSSVAHEIFNPLVPVQTFLMDEDMEKLLSRPLEGEPQLERIRASLVTLLPCARTGLRQAISYTRELKNRGSFASLSLQYLNLTALVGEFTSQYRELTALPKQHVMIAFSPIGEAVTAEADERLLKSVLRILLDNAVDASAKDRTNQIVVMVDRTNRHAVITVRDEGRGMTEEQQKRYGQPQFSIKPGGTGVGTAVARRFVNEMGGELRLESSSPQGTTIQILLPILAHRRG